MWYDKKDVHIGKSIEDVADHLKPGLLVGWYNPSDVVWNLHQGMVLVSPILAVQNTSRGKKILVEGDNGFFDVSVKGWGLKNPWCVVELQKEFNTQRILDTIQFINK